MVKSKCSECRKTIVKRNLDFLKGTLHFCSHRCRAIYYNHKRRTLFPRPCLRPGCSNLVTAQDRSKKYCSLRCANHYRLSRYNPEVIIENIRLFASIMGRIPTKIELSYIYRVSRQYFGTWNKAIIAAGFFPNPVMFAHKHTANDGHQCDSLAEKIVDDWLFTHNVKHEIHTPYPWNNGMKCDFWVSGIWIEVFGLAGQNAEYDKLKRKKLSLIRKYSLKLISISLNDVYQGGLDRKLIELI